MHIRCPHCHEAVEIIGDQEINEASCPICGSAFELLPETTSFWLSKRSVGHFELLDQLGTGGYGTVWKARDTKLDRLVAIKVPRIDRLNGEEGELFFREARAAAQLRHPHIVAVHEVGREDGTLYIVSDFVQGITLADRLTATPYTPREAAELLATVADALHHAHEAGVIHRDLKPQNIMLDGQGSPRLMDFGLAKREAGEITMTIDGKVLGTPAYMSPEQARGEGHRVDRRTDVYSLGVILFELLTGDRPFRGNQRMLLHQVIHDEPPSPRKLNSRIPRDLETICLKALAKVPANRYPAAHDVADDLRRYLSGEPIHARPVGRVEKAWRWCQRNPTIAGLTGAMCASLIAVTVVSTFFAIHSERARRASEQARVDIAKEQEATALERDQKDKALMAKTEALEAETKARKAERQIRDQAMAALRATTNIMVEDELASATLLTEEKQKFLREIIKHYEGFAALTADDIESRRIRADGHVQVGRMRIQLGELPKADNSLSDGVAILKQLVTEFPTRADLRWELTEGQNVLANFYKRTGRVNAAEAEFMDSVANLKRLAAPDPRFRIDPPEVLRFRLAVNYNSLGNIFKDTNRSQDAEAKYIEARDIYKQLVAEFPLRGNFRQALAMTHNNLGALQSASRRFGEAETSFNAALDVSKKLADDFPTRPDFHDEWANAYNSLGTVLKSTGRADEAQSAYESGLVIQKKLVADFPARPMFRQRLASTYHNLGLLLVDGRRIADAETAYSQALSIRKELAANYSDDPVIRDQLAGTLVAMAQLSLFQRADFSKAVSQLHEAEPHHLAALTANSLHAGFRHRYMLNLVYLAAANAGLGNQARSLRTAELIRDLGWNPPEDAYDGAFALATCSNTVKILNSGEVAVQFYSDQAMLMLRDAVAKGFKDMAKLKNNRALEPLHKRDDFQQLLAELEAANANK